MIYICESETFLNNFIQMASKKNILDMQYVLVSSQITKGGEYKTVIAMSKLIPTHNLLKMASSKDMKDEFKDGYREQLDENKAAIAATIIYTIGEEGGDVMFLCSKKEWKNYGYLKELGKYIENTFGFPVYNVKKILAGNETEKDWDKTQVKKICKKIIDKTNKEKEKLQLETSHGRKKVISKMKKSEMEKKLRKANLYYRGMSKSDMRDAMETILGN